MGIKVRYGGVFAVIALVLSVMPVFVVPASALDYTGWNFDFDITPSTINLGQTVNITVHVYYWGNDSKKQPFTADAPGQTVTITSPFFNTIEVTDSHGYLNNTDHPDEIGNYTYTATVIFQAETKTKSLTLTVNPEGTATPASTPVVTVQPSPSPIAGNVTAIPTPTEIIATAVPPTPTPAPTPSATKTPSWLMSTIGTISVLMLVGLLSRKKR